LFGDRNAQVNGLLFYEYQKKIHKTRFQKNPLPSKQARRYREEPDERSKGESNNLKTIELPTAANNRLYPMSFS